MTAVLVATAVGAAVALWSAPRGGRLSQTVTRVVLVGLLAGSVLAAATAWTGGPIGHPEIRPVATR